MRWYFRTASGGQVGHVVHVEGKWFTECEDPKKVPEEVAVSACEFALPEKGGGIVELTDGPADDTDSWNGFEVKLVDGPDERTLVVAPTDGNEGSKWEEEVGISILVAFSICTDESFSADLRWKDFTIITSSSS